MCTKVVPQLIEGTKALWPLHNLGQAADATTKALKHHPITFPNNLRKGVKAVQDDEVEGVAKPESFNDFEQFIDNFFLHAVDVPL